MIKKYRVFWRTKNDSGEVEVETADFSQIGALVFAFFEGHMPGCPFVITRVILVDPAQYFRGC